MKVKNLLDDIESKSLDELNNLADKIIDNLEKKNNMITLEIFLLIRI